uniref:AlNc14C205G8787 protein n=1 Tax=Albugo laibachii Nc14 TaxID=890382 RepID=F0WQX7_9STRA|nr:AlNc14C205G8787 [Albugo laibachii Nc14]|eukprot:CCA23737.1 AlNc14C205G8787 [Albugo laibachii Nc14]
MKAGTISISSVFAQLVEISTVHQYIRLHLICFPFCPHCACGATLSASTTLTWDLWYNFHLLRSPFHCSDQTCAFNTTNGCPTNAYAIGSTSPLGITKMKPFPRHTVREKYRVP